MILSNDEKKNFREDLKSFTRKEITWNEVVQRNKKMVSYTLLLLAIIISLLQLLGYGIYIEFIRDGQLYKEAVYHYNSGYYSLAQDDLGEILHHNPNHEEALKLKKIVDEEKEKQEISYLEERIAVTKASEDYKMAYAYSKELLEKDPQNPNYAEQVKEFKALADEKTIAGYMQKINSLRNENNYKEAYEQAAQLSSKFPERQDFAALVQELQSQKDTQSVLDEEKKNIDSLLSSGDTKGLQALYPSVTEANKAYIKEQCEAKIVKYINTQLEDGTMKRANATNYLNMYNIMCGYADVGYSKSKKITEILNSLHNLSENQNIIDNAGKYDGVIKDIDDVYQMGILVLKRIGNGNHVAIAGYDITSKYLDEYTFYSDDLGGDGVGILVSSEAVSQGYLEAYFMYVGDGEYVDESGFEYSYPKYKIVTEQDIKKYKEHMDAQASIDKAKEKKESLLTALKNAAN